MQHSKSTDLFNAIINTLGLREMYMSGGQYTRTNNQSHPTLEKLDRVLISDSWECLFPLASLRKLVRELSDDNPLLLYTDEEKREPSKSREFRFDLSWLKDDRFLDLVTKIWSRKVAASDPIDILNIKLKRFKSYFKG